MLAVDRILPPMHNHRRTEYLDCCIVDHHENAGVSRCLSRHAHARQRRRQHGDGSKQTKTGVGGTMPIYLLMCMYVHKQQRRLLSTTHILDCRM